MTITITARDSDGNRTGVDFSTFFSTFYQEFTGLPSQYGGGHQYGVYQENGSSILFNGTEDWVIDPENSSGTTGNFNQIVFGGDFQPAEGATGTNSADLTIDFPQVFDASTRLLIFVSTRAVFLLRADPRCGPQRSEIDHQFALTAGSTRNGKVDQFVLETNS